MLALFMAFLLPALLVYPSVHFFSERRAAPAHRRARRGYAVQAMTHPQALQDRLHGRRKRDRRAAAAGTRRTRRAARRPTAPRTEVAFRIWSQTVLARQRLTSDVEIYDARTARWLSRFALNFPEYTALAQTPGAPRQTASGTCTARRSSFGGAQERNTLHAQRSVCVDGTADRHARRARRLRLPHAAVHQLAVGVLRRVRRRRRGAARSKGRRRATSSSSVYGWGLTTIYIVRARRVAARRRRPSSASTRSRAAVLDGRRQGRPAVSTSTSPTIASSSTRSAIAIPSVFDHLVRLAELTTLAAAAYVAGAARATPCSRGSAAGRPQTGRSLLREIRASFYRKLFLAFVLASIFPVLTWRS